jgi:hypothetical protein
MAIDQHPANQKPTSVAQGLPLAQGRPWVCGSKLETNHMKPSPTPYIGAFLCCDTPPVLGNHNHHSWTHTDPRTGKVTEYKYQPGYGYYCPVCHRSRAVLGGGPAFATKCWNVRFLRADQRTTFGIVPQPPINAPEGWLYARLEVQCATMGAMEGFEHDAILFKTSKIQSQLRTVIDKALPDLQIMTITGEKTDVDWLGKARASTASISESWCTDGTTCPTLNISTQGPKYRRLAQSLISSLWNGAELQRIRS